MTRPDPDPSANDPLRDVWANAQPPRPSGAAWRKVQDAIAAELRSVRRARTARRWTTAGLAGGLAAGVAIAVGVWPRPTPAPPVVEVAFDPLAEYDVLPIATEYDVMVSVVRSNSIELVACEHPLPGVMPLATPSDVTIARTDTGIKSTAAPADAPVLVEVQDK